MSIETILVPDLGGAESVDVIEVCVSEGDSVEVEQSILVLESDKASMEIPSPLSGKITKVLVNEGDSIGEGAPVFEVEVSGAESTAVKEPESPIAEEPASEVELSKAEEAAPADNKAASNGSSVSEQTVCVPDVGGSDTVEVIEVCVADGDSVAEGDSLVVLESDKASMEIPAPAAGTVVSMKLSEGDKVATGDVIALMAVAGSPESASPDTAAAAPATVEVATPPPVASVPSSEAVSKPATAIDTARDAARDTVDAAEASAYAGPAARKLARQLGVDLTRVGSSGPRKRVTREDIRHYVQQVVEQVESGKVSSGSGIPPIPEVDFAQFGEVELQKMNKVAKLTVQNMSRSWLNVPHVTQFDEADISELEAFRKSMKAEAEQRGVKLTPLPFLMKAAASALVREPSFNVSLHADGEHKVQKKYVHIGMAVDTPNGLMVPVIRDVDQKSLWQLAAETGEMAAKARAGKLMPKDMQGGCFTISSLGAIGGNGFTPIVNAPEVAIMGVSKAQIKPIWNGSEFEPRQMLPLSVSYDHRAINGADCGRFFTYLVEVLGDIRKLLL